MLSPSGVVAWISALLGVQPVTVFSSVKLASTWIQSPLVSRYITSRPRSISASLVDDASGERYSPATRIVAARTTSAESEASNSNANTKAANVLAILWHLRLEFGRAGQDQYYPH